MKYQQLLVILIVVFPDLAFSESSVFMYPGKQGSSNAFNLTNEGSTGEDYVKKLLKAQDQAGVINIKKDKKSLSLTGSSVDILQFELNKVPFCSKEVKISYSAKGNAPFIAGEIPSTNEDFHSQSFPSKENAKNILDDYLNNMNKDNWTILIDRPCYWQTDDKIIPVYEIEVELALHPYRALVSGNKVELFVAKFFEVDGQTKIYPKNIDAGEDLTNYPIKNFVGNGQLDNTWFATNTSGVAQVTALDHDFAESPGTLQFQELSVFTNAYRAYEWLANYGYSSFGSQKIEIVLHDDEFLTDNAVYFPSSRSNPQPHIYIGEEGDFLKNLYTDTDVVSHEFNHHVIYSSIKEPVGDALILHEGLADILTFLRTDDPCLGESICKEGSNACYISGKCLRTAENDIAYQSGNYPGQSKQEHLAGQMISGLIWDYYKKDSLPKDTVVKLVLKTIDIMPRQPSLQTFALGLLTADAELNEGANCETLYNGFEQRKLDTVLSGANCSNFSDIAIFDSSAEDVTKTATNTYRKETEATCGVIGHHDFPHWFGLMLLIMPIVLWFIGDKNRMPARQVARSRHKNYKKSQYPKDY